MKVGIGYRNEKDAFLSGKLVAEAAIRNGSIERPDIVLAFCGGRIDAAVFFKGLQSIIGKRTPIIGGSAVGVFINTDMSYEGYSTGIAIFQSDSVRCKIAAAGDMDQDERSAGIKMARQLPFGPEDKLLLIFYDSVKIPPSESSPPVINASPPLISGIEEVSGAGVPLIGAGLLGDHSFSPTKQFLGSSVGSQSIVGALLSGNFKVFFRTMHGCLPLDGVYHTITKIKGNVIYELDGKPVVEMIDAIYGDLKWQRQIPVRRLSIGVQMGEKYAQFNESHYVNRLITGILPNGEGIALFEPDLEEGMDIQFMIRDAEEILASARRNSTEIMKSIHDQGKKPVFGLYIDCAGRCASFSEMPTEEASEVVEVFNQYDVPLLGFYSGVEVAPFAGKSCGLDWTGVLVVFAEG